MSQSENSPLQGISVVVTRPENQGTSLIKGLERLGAQALHQPGLVITPVSHVMWPSLSGPEKLCIVFMSANAVRCAQGFLTSESFTKVGPSIAVWAIGEATAAALAQLGLDQVSAPQVATSEGLISDQRFMADAAETVWIVQAENGRSYLGQQLHKVSERVEVIHDYRLEPVVDLSTAFTTRCQSATIDYVISNSCFALESMSEQLPEQALNGWFNATVVSGSDRVIKKAREIGFMSVPVHAADTSDQTMIEAILDHRKSIATTN